MVMIPPRPEQAIINAAYAHFEAEDAKRPLYLGRLGASFIGKECIRQIWLDWRGYARVKFSGRMLRLFETGHQQEARIIADLRNAGLTVHDVNAEGNQFEFTDETGHLVCKVDGVATAVPESTKPHVLEAKSHNKNSFGGLKKGVQKAKPEHYTQVQTGMVLSGLERGLYVSVCKDDEQLYVEKVRPDKPLQQKILQRTKDLVAARLRPVGISDDGESFGCKYCDMKEVCTGRAAPLRHCRTCQHARPVSGGLWHCEHLDQNLTPDLQRMGCSDYSVL
jgi:hypothetical protein